MDELRRIIEDSEIMAEDDELWPQPDRVGRQELEIVIGDEHISFTTSKIGRSDNFFLTHHYTPIYILSFLHPWFTLQPC